MEQAADYINQSFINIGPSLAATLNQEWEYGGADVEGRIGDIGTNRNEIEILCRKINVNKSSGIKHITTWMLKEAFLTVPDPITEIINMSFIKNVCPDTWKTANVVPLQKEGNKQLFHYCLYKAK